MLKLFTVRLRNQPVSRTATLREYSAHRQVSVRWFLASEIGWQWRFWEFVQQLMQSVPFHHLCCYKSETSLFQGLLLYRWQEVICACTHEQSLYKLYVVTVRVNVDNTGTDTSLLTNLRKSLYLATSVLWLLLWLFITLNHFKWLFFAVIVTMSNDYVQWLCPELHYVISELASSSKFCLRQCDR